MQVRFWGTRGSLAKPGPSTVRFGGNTSCVEVRADDGTLIVLDCGTGAHDLGRRLVAEAPGPVNGSLLISHTHWDHIQGIPFFAPFFVPGNEWDIYAPQGFSDTLRTTLAGQMEYTYFPITADAFGASIRYHHVTEGSFRIGGVQVHTRFLNHPALTIGYRIEADGASVVYACDHEPHAATAALATGSIDGQDRLHSEFLRGADLVIHDAQYTAAEYPAKVGWGHSTVEYAIAVCAEADVKQLALTHHDPMRDDDAMDDVLAEAQERAVATGLTVIAAREGMTIELRGEPTLTRRKRAVSAMEQEPSTSLDLVVLTADDELFERIAKVGTSEGLQPVQVRAETFLPAAIGDGPPALLIIDGNCAPRTSPLDEKLPTLILGGDSPASVAANVEHIADGWTPEYLRARVRTWVMRGTFGHVPAAIPEDEAERLKSLYALNILDTPPEERFDRLTRIAARMFDVPTSLISIVDRDRQWFKSKQGIDADGTPRHLSFCAHAIAQDDALIVPDALADARFAQHPLVLGDPRVRFYAGVPLRSGSQPVGTLCLIDSKPRELSDSDLQALQDLGSMVERELHASANA